jgi:hypothetical protein
MAQSPKILTWTQRTEQVEEVEHAHAQWRKAVPLICTGSHLHTPVIADEDTSKLDSLGLWFSFCWATRPSFVPEHQT